MDERFALAAVRARSCAPTGSHAEQRMVSAAVRGARSGDADGVKYLYVRYAGDVHAFVRSIVHDDHEAEDLTQQVFANLPKRIQRYEERAVPFKAWLFRVARNSALDFLRSRRASPVAEVFSVDASSDDRHLGNALKDALKDLPADQREVLFLRHVVGLTPGEIAQRLGRSEGAIHGLHHRGRRATQVELTRLGAAPSTA